jgi:Phage-related minor tail protein
MATNWLFGFKIIGDSSNAIRALNELSEKLEVVEERTAAVTKVAAKLATTGAAALAGGAAIALPLTKMVAGYEDAQEAINNIAAARGGLNDKERESLELWARQQALVTGFDASQYLDTAYQVASAGITSIRSIEAIAATSGRVARVTKGDATQTASTLTTLALNFEDHTKTALENISTIGDKVAVIQTSGKWGNLTLLNDALGEGTKASIAFKVSLDQTLGGVSAFAAAGEAGASAGVAWAETLTALPKLADKLHVKLVQNAQGGLDVLSTLKEIDAATKNMSAVDRGNLLKGREGMRTAELLSHVDVFERETQAAANAAGATDKALSQFQQHGLLAFQQLHQAISNVGDSIGGALAPQIERLTKHLAGFAQWIEKISENHGTLLRIGTTIAAIAAAVLVIGGALALASSALLGFATLVPVVMAFARVARLATVAQLALDAALSPIGLAVIGVVALAAAVYLAYQHWQAFHNLVDKTVQWFESINWKSAGITILKEIGEGLLSGIAYLTGPLGVVGKYIIDHFKGHSPPPLGPLHQLNQLRIVETIAATMRPAAIIPGVRNVAGVIANGMTPGMRMAGAGAGGGTVVNVNVTYHVNASSSEEFASVARRHADTLTRIIRDKLAREARLKFE